MQIISYIFIIIKHIQVSSQFRMLLMLWGTPYLTNTRGRHSFIVEVARTTLNSLCTQTSLFWHFYGPISVHVIVHSCYIFIWEKEIISILEGDICSSWKLRTTLNSLCTQTSLFWHFFQVIYFYGPISVHVIVHSCYSLIWEKEIISTILRKSERNIMYKSCGKFSTTCS